MTILKESLVYAGYQCDIIYWNIILQDVISKYFFNADEEKLNEVTLLSIFYSYIAIKYKDNDSLLKQEALLRALKPQYANISGFDYREHIIECANELEKVIKDKIKEECFEQSLFVGMSMSLFQWVPASVIASLIKETVPTTFIAIGGIGNSKLANAFLSNFSCSI